MVTEGGDKVWSLPNLYEALKLLLKNRKTERGWEHACHIIKTAFSGPKRTEREEMLEKQGIFQLISEVYCELKKEKSFVKSRYIIDLLLHGILCPDFIKHFSQEKVFELLIEELTHSGQIAKVLEAIIEEKEDACTWFMNTKESFQLLAETMAIHDPRESVDALSLFSTVFASVSFEKKLEIAEFETRRCSRMLEFAIKHLDGLKESNLRVFLTQLLGFLRRLSEKNDKKYLLKKLVSVARKQVLGLISYISYKRNATLQECFTDILQFIDERPTSAKKEKITADKIQNDETNKSEKKKVSRAKNEKPKADQTNKILIEEKKTPNPKNSLSKKIVRLNSMLQAAKEGKEFLDRSEYQIPRGRVLRNGAKFGVSGSIWRTPSKKPSRLSSLSRSAEKKIIVQRKTSKNRDAGFVSKVFKRTSTIEDVIESTQNMIDISDYGRGKRERQDLSHLEELGKIVKK